MRIAIYVRVSTQRQAQAQTIEQQIERLRAHVRGLGEHLADDDIFRDDGYSGASLRRPGLDRLRDRAALASFDRLYVTDPDRLARNYVHQVLLIEELQQHGCQVEFLDRPMSRDPHDQLLLQIRGAVAEYERTLIAERTRRGRQHMFRTGQMLPWTRPPYGYRLDPERPRDPSGVRLEPAEAAVVAEIFAWYVRDGHTLLGLVKQLHELGVPSPSGKPYWGLASVRGVLTNPSYTGQVYAGRTRYRPAKVRRSATHPIGRPHETAVPVPEEEWIAVGAIPAIVTREQFDLARAKLATNRTFDAAITRPPATCSGHSSAAATAAWPARRDVSCRTVATTSAPGNIFKSDNGRGRPAPRGSSRRPRSTTWSGRTYATWCSTPRSWPRPCAGRPGGTGSPRSGKHGGTACAAGGPAWPSSWSA
jgi:site-specific DNA recombinase